ncbi:hypothetical protein Y032_0019g3809 [Ancylostoma ceylanicum]|uniref:Uncharacterized protein n=1 Tax=Ancylostoma ceylanicum TaxID=53326 RepID=A0A016V174_9BILA|nr:hypothetical protein Y032_0019g3809 [Ancylostoma ceylanicum]
MEGNSSLERVCFHSSSYALEPQYSSLALARIPSLITRVRSRHTPQRDRAARVCFLNPDCSFKFDALNDIRGHLLTVFQLQQYPSVPPAVQEVVYTTTCALHHHVCFGRVQPRRGCESINHSPAAYLLSRSPDNCASMNAAQTA